MRQLLITLSVFCVSCNGTHSKNAPPNVDAAKHRLDTLHVRQAAKDIADVQHFIWTPNHADTTAWLCETEFRDEYAVISFHGQCVYYFFTSMTLAKGQQQLALEWTYKTDCVFDMPFLRQSHGLKRFPKYGDEFASYTLLNDTTLAVKYSFPEWVDKVNRIAKDSLFPRRLYLRPPGGS